MTAPSARPRPSPLGRVVRVLGSFPLAVTIFSLLFVVVLVGTLAQKHTSLYDVQRLYFESLVFTVKVFGAVPLPVPGGALLLGLLTVNLVVGGVLRMRLRTSTLGILGTHVGILVLFVGSAIEYAASEKGHVVLKQGESASVFESYTDWELAVVDVEARTERILRQDRLERAQGGPLTVRAEGLPFTLVVSGFAPNTDAERAPGGGGAEGFVLRPLPRDPKQAERNVAGCYVDVRPLDGGPAARGLLWGQAQAPFSAVVGGRAFAFELRRATFPLPYAVRLDRAVAREHPGTAMASEYSSYVTRIAPGSPGDGDAPRERAIHITMNQPMREGGLTLYQSTYGRDEQGRVYSGLAVVRNPTDRVPIVACSIIGVAMAAHFLRKLSRHVRTQASVRAARAAAGAA